MLRGSIILTLRVPPNEFGQVQSVRVAVPTQSVETSGFMGP